MSMIHVIFISFLFTFSLFMVLSKLGLLPTPFLSLYSYLCHFIFAKAKFAPKEARPFNFHEIIPNVYVGTQPRNEKDIKFLYKEVGITAIICLNEERELFVPSTHYSFMPYFSSKETRLHVPIPDYQGPDVDQLAQCVNFIHEKISQNSADSGEINKVYVHCNGGKGRSAAVVVAYILATNSEIGTVKDAVKIVRKRRKKTSRSLEFYPFSSQSRYLRKFHEQNQKEPVLNLDDQVEPEREGENELIEEENDNEISEVDTYTLVETAKENLAGMSLRNRKMPVEAVKILV